MPGSVEPATSTLLSRRLAPPNRRSAPRLQRLFFTQSCASCVISCSTASRFGSAMYFLIVSAASCLASSILPWCAFALPIQ